MSAHALEDDDNSNSSHVGRTQTCERSGPIQEELPGPAYPTTGKRTRDTYENADGKILLSALKCRGAVTAMAYHSAVPNPEAKDIWPHFRDEAKLPAHYHLLDVSRDPPRVEQPVEQARKAMQNVYELRCQKDLTVATIATIEHPSNPAGIHSPRSSQCRASTSNPDILCKGRPLWQLPVELIEQIMEHLSRDDIKSLRLVSHEMNNYTSQAAFKTVVVPFNTEIYGLLGQHPRSDWKGKGRVNNGEPVCLWKCPDGKKAYTGQGFDVFRGFGRHILRYAMSFEVTEDCLSTPPLKTVTEQKTSFWGKYDWPFGEYRRFDTVAGLESAADETPRMKTAFSELTKVNELALAVDSGLGWLNGPDRSIRARILQHPPSVFGTCQTVPDRRTQAQNELWNYINTMHSQAGEDIRTASLYKLDGTRLLTKAQEKGLHAKHQPRLPFLDPHVVHIATPHDTTDCLMPQTLEDPHSLDYCNSGSRFANDGVLFTSTAPQPCDSAQVTGPIIPAALSKAQKEWLLETEWAQRAFMSSYMLSVIDNSATFTAMHTLNISSLSDCYISLLNRADFWAALPNLKNVTLMIVPNWRMVLKDEAGIVETPRVDPTGEIDTFCNLLSAQIASKPKIKKLTVGFTTGGEHAEGLHARNKLLMPAPLLLLRACKRTDPARPEIHTAISQDVNMLRQAVLRFPFLEEFTLRNCWITPTALLEFVRIHNECSLKHLSLDSVSLTALLRPISNPQAPQAVQNAAQNVHIPPQVAGVLWNLTNNNNVGNNAAPAHQFPANNPLLNLYIQSLIVQLQHMQTNAGGVHHQHHIQTLQAQLQLQLHNTQPQNPQQPAGLPLPVTHNPVQQNTQGQQQPNIHQTAHLNLLANQVNVMQHIFAGQGAPTGTTINSSNNGLNSILQTRPREGSWLDVIDQMSPGTNLSDFGSPYSQADTTRITSLLSISLASCGYAKLPHLPSGADQSGIEAANGFAAALRSPFFTKRYNALSSAMLSSKWPYLGEIVQEVDLNEIAALNAAWSFRYGWDDTEAAKAVEFDGLLSGGTGRFTGKVQRSDRVNTEAKSLN